MVRNAVNYFFGERHKILLDINDYKDEKYEKNRNSYINNNNASLYE